MINYHKKIIFLNNKINIKFNKKYKKYILFINDYVIYPGVILPINIINKNLINLIYNKIFLKKKLLCLFVKKNIFNININKNIYNLGILVKILKIYKMFDDSIILILQGLYKCKINNINKLNKIKIYDNILYKFNIKFFKENKIKLKNKIYFSYLNLLKKESIKLIIYNKYNNINNLIYIIKNIENISLLIYFLLLYLKIDLKYKYLILKEKKYYKKSNILLKFIKFEIYKFNIINEINEKIKKKIKKHQIKYYLNQQIKLLNKKLGNNNNNKDINNLIKKKKKKKLSKNAVIKYNEEIEKLKNTNINLPEYNIIKNYLDFLLKLPWKIYSNKLYNIKLAKKILNKNHFGLKKVKNRILEYLSILKLNKNKKSPILCFVGPPGVGKTTLVKSISKVLLRKYVKISLGGIYDESEIRGHRKTYIGAMPGRILQLLSKVGISNPIFLLDEIDKISIRGYNGNISSALLEVLDPEQNKYFYDNYLELEFDLSKIFFIATANDITNINYTLLDRMEVININGYTIEEKVKIVKKFIFNKLIIKNGLKKYNFKQLKKKYIRYIILNYTNESGIRNLERKLDKIIRYIAKNLVINKKLIKKINKKIIYKILGPNNNINKYQKINTYGVSIGLAWTGFGGDIIYIESKLLKKGKGNISITGNLGKIMKESIIIALKYIRYNYKKYNIKLKYFYNYDIHIHVPEGSIPKDGPSAGIAIFTSLISSYTKKKIKNFLAMTGEITLRGKVLPVGGIKEKLLAAKRYNINKVILSKYNKNNVKFINKKYFKNITFYYINKIDDIINIIFSN
ncbi:MAG: endopeptidase La [Candidatus Shikimatogenerans sp. JK-2022]|nr:endopeptidase La [Candidatus Shikimatogenerans bostrichidophilus]